MTAVVRYRAYCNDPLCSWSADESWSDEENAWTDWRAHIEGEHTACSGVRSEVTQ